MVPTVVPALLALTSAGQRRTAHFALNQRSPAPASARSRPLEPRIRVRIPGAQPKLEGHARPRSCVVQ